MERQMDRSEAINDLANSMAADLSNLERVHVAIDAFEEAAMQLVHKGGIPIDRVETERMRHAFMANLHSVGSRDLSLMLVCVVSALIDARDDLDLAYGQMLEMEGDGHEG